MPTWKLTLEYDGTRYHGWQSQKNTDRTVQGALARAARELLGIDAAVGGAGRTDAGVHALAQVAHLKARAVLSPVEIEHGLNDRLPFDVNVIAVETADPSFHARHDATSRRYLYRISKKRTAFDKRLVWWVKDRLDAASMRAAAELFVGRHDFAAFCENAAGQDSTVVVVAKTGLTEAGSELHFRIEASHFLWKMVRRLVGTLVEVGRGHLSPMEVTGLLRGLPAPPTAAWTAPPSGLFLEEVLYGRIPHGPALATREGPPGPRAARKDHGRGAPGAPPRGASTPRRTRPDPRRGPRKTGR